YDPLRWCAQRANDHQMIFLAAGSRQRFYHQVPQAVTALLRLLQAMKDVAVRGIAVTTADRVVRMATQQHFPDAVDQRKIHREALMASQRNGWLQLAENELFNLIIFLFDIVANRSDGFVDAGIAR